MHKENLVAPYTANDPISSQSLLQPVTGWSYLRLICQLPAGDIEWT